jgi:hypothetical protein
MVGTCFCKPSEVDDSNTIYEPYWSAYRYIINNKLSGPSIPQSYPVYMSYIIGMYKNLKFRVRRYFAKIIHKHSVNYEVLDGTANSKCRRIRDNLDDDKWTFGTTGENEDEIMRLVDADGSGYHIQTPDIPYIPHIPETKLTRALHVMYRIDERMGYIESGPNSPSYDQWNHGYAEQFETEVNELSALDLATWDPAVKRHRSWGKCDGECHWCVKSGAIGFALGTTTNSFLI